MKKFLLLLLAANICLALGAQTYFYKQTAMVEKDSGVKSKGSGSSLYITFQDNKNSCYYSNADGTATRPNSGTETSFGFSTGRRYEGGSLFVYIGENNGRHEYMRETTYYAYIQPNMSAGERGGYYPMTKSRVYLYFTPNYDRMNEWSDPQTYEAVSGGYESQSVKSARSATMAGAKAGYNPNQSTYIFVYEKAQSAEERTEKPVIMY